MELQKKKSLLVLGAGGHGHVVYDTARSMKCSGKFVYDNIDFLDDNPSPENVIGSLSQLPIYAKKYDEVFCAIGNPTLRKEMLSALKVFSITIPTLVHATACVSPSAVIGEGSIVCPGAMVNSRSQIGNGVILSMGAMVDHDVKIHDFAQVDVGAICLRGSEVPEGKKLPAGSRLLHNEIYNERE